MSELLKTKPAPINWSKVATTGNNAIDLVAQCVGHARATRRPISAIILKPSSHDQFRAGLMVLMAQAGEVMTEDPAAILTFDGVEIKRGSSYQFDTMKVEYFNRKMPLAN
jgi:hypothetical protein